MGKKIVLYPIEVPDGKYCWDHTGTFEICEFFDSEGGHSHCLLNFWEQRDAKDGKGILKPKECYCLQEKEGV